MKWLNLVLTILLLTGLILIAHGADKLSAQRQIDTLVADKICQLVVDGEYIAESQAGKYKCYKKIL